MTYKLVLYTHVLAGIIAIISGFTALSVKKGARLHRKAGLVFFASMVFTAAGASYLGYFAPVQDMNDVASGALTIYLVATAWMTVKRRDGQIGYFEPIAFVTAALGSAFSFYIAFQAVQRGDALFNGVPSYIFSSFIALAALLDLRMILLGGLHGAQRIARHVWRMCLGLFIAAGSFFLGQMQVFPKELQRIEIVSVPVVLIVLLMSYWMVIVLFTGKYKGVRQANR